MLRYLKKEKKKDHRCSSARFQPDWNQASRIQIQNLRSDLSIVTSTLDVVRWAETRIQFSPLSPQPTDPIFRSARPSRSFRGERTSNLAELYTWVFCQNRKRSLAFPPFSYIRQRAKLAKEEGVGREGKEGGGARIDAFSRPLQNSFGHIICRCGQESEQRLRSTTIFRDAYGKRIHNDGHCAEP